MQLAAKVGHTEIDRLFMERVHTGALSILVSGAVLNTKTNRWLAQAGDVDRQITIWIPSSGNKRGTSRGMFNTRLAYLVFIGEIPVGQEVYVDNSLNPSLLLTARLRLRNYRSGRGKDRTIHPNGKIDRAMVPTYRKRFHSGLVTGRELARQIGCAHPSVSFMLNGHTFKREDGPTETFLDGITTMTLAAGMTLAEAEEEFGMTEAEHLTAISRYAHLLDD